MILLSLLLGTALAKIHYNVDLQCPHDTRQDTGYTYGSIDMPATDLVNVQATAIESSCPFEMHVLRKAIQPITILSWHKASGTAEGTNAGANTFTGSAQASSAQGLCTFDSSTTTYLAFTRKGLLCVEYSCNKTHCIPTVHVIIPQLLCQTVRSCTLTWLNNKIQLNFDRTFCPHGMVVAGNCFQPLYHARSTPQHVEEMDLTVTCFLTHGKLQSSVKLTNEKIMKELETQAGKTDCTDNNFFGYYTCFLMGYSISILVPQQNDLLADEILYKMVNQTLGEDHDRIGEGQNSLRLAGKTEISIKETTEKVEAYCYSGAILYTSVFVYPKTVDNRNPLVMTKGVIPRINHTTCDKKLLPITWRGVISVPGFIEKLDPCKVFCSLTGPGASCEAFSPTGIFNISSPTCLIGKLHRYKALEDQISFVCQRIDTDIIVYCNGQRKVIRTETLVIGQCIYTFTSMFSFIPRVAHSIAVEICVTGFHGWATIMLIITFCFGWVLIPAGTWIAIQLVKGLLIIFNKHTGTSRWKQIMTKLREEFNHTVGNTTCKVCYTETACPEELVSHNSYCEKGICPYCMKDVGQSPVLLSEHFKACILNDKFIRKIKETIKLPSPATTLYRRVNTFRYQNRCYICMVWILLLLIESCIWAATATPIKKEEPNKIWSDTAHGVGYVPMHLDYELDFALSSGSSYIHKRILTDPSKPDRTIPLTLDIGHQVITATSQYLGKWLDAELNVKSVFHCYGACNKWSYPWQYAACKREVDFEYQTAWNCNPGDCPGVGTGCTACGLFLDKLRPKSTVVKIISIKYTRRVCYQLGTEHACKELDSTDCLSANHIKICIIGTASDLQISDTLVFLGPYDAGAIVVKQWCTSNCKFGDPGDLMDVMGNVHCPSFDGSVQRTCAFATEPHCTYQGNTVSGYKRLLSTKDSFQSVNMTKVKFSLNSLTWEDSADKYKDHINIVVSKDLDFEELSENPCVVDIVATSIEGSWGSGIGFKLTCAVSLTECSDFMTTIKACDEAMCYGGTVIGLTRGQNTVNVQGRGGHSGSKFKCCHDMKCSETGLQASSPHLERVDDNYSAKSIAFDDGAPDCKIACWATKVHEWLKGLFTGNWWVILILCAITFFSVLTLSLLCPARKIKSV